MRTVTDYASVVFAGFTAISAGWYFVRGRKEFTGPPVAPGAKEGEVVELPSASGGIHEKINREASSELGP
jgi:hypothetical protein